MACCAGPSGRAGAVPAAPPDIPDGVAAPPLRVRFVGGHSHVGTTRPEIPADGEGLVRKVRLNPFAADAHPVTNARFAAFVTATGYLTESERLGTGLVFRGLMAEAAPADPAMPWWAVREGASWRAPEGPGSDLRGREDHPATHLSWNDARTFAAWAGGRLPTESEWEHAARGGLPGDPRFTWGEEEPNDTRFMPCNIWQGRFPNENTCADGWFGTSPVGAFPANGVGLHDMAGNVWEWTADPFRVRSASREATARNALARRESQKAMKGGSFLCHRSYCYRYRIAARIAVAADSGSSNTGVRVFYDA